MKIALFVFAIALTCASCRHPSIEYVAQINGERIAKDAAFRNQPEPIPENLKNRFLPLVYYPPDLRYDVLATLTPSNEPRRTLQMVYSDGAVREVMQVGTLEFILNRKRLRLGAFVEVGAPDVNNLFVPFGDLTNGTETYHGGRILDVKRSTNDLYFLDFNRAYNPSCYFSPQYSCPLPPTGNRLPIAVRAGEKIRTLPDI